MRTAAAGKAQLHMWTPDGLSGVTLFRAEQFQQRFARHTHDEYALGVITSGVLGFDYRGAHHLAGRGEINVVVPGEVHTGQPERGDHWSYRMFYLAPALVADIAQQSGRGRGQPFFPAGVIRDENLAATVIQLHHDLDAQRIGALEAESRLIALMTTWMLHHGEKPRSPKAGAHGLNVARVRELLDDCGSDNPALGTLARLVNLSPYQLLRAFMRQYGLPPHAWLIQRRVREARGMIERGVPVAEAAASSGFADQSHLNRHFKRILGFTPGRYRNFVQEGGRGRQ
ncbi:MAG TPA: AraC family transcriptional regulator [Steroidobacteraceae bacterium]|nr:AraC family transcriptional regulator [Steroidobacteraceae bacterium]